VARGDSTAALRIAVHLLYGHIYGMKTTIEIPDELYRKLKARSAASGKTVREVVVGLVQEWLKGSLKGRTDSVEREIAEQDKTAELRRWLDEAAAISAASPPGPTAMEHLLAGRNRPGRRRK
jgi:hypothetical protein